MVIDVKRLRRYGRLPWFMVASWFNSIFTALTIFGPAFIFFLSDIGLDKVRIGALLSLIPFAGLLAPIAASAVGRFGLRRTFLVFWSVRKVFFALMLLVPAILGSLGHDFAFWWVAGIVLMFSASRALAETGFYPWLQDLVPDKIRGQFWAINGIVSTVGSMIAIAAASYVTDHMTGIERYMILFIVGILFGVIGILSYARLPGGGPVQTNEAGSNRFTEMHQALRDTNFMRFLLVLALISIGGSVGGSFVALYANEQIGLSSGHVILLSIGSSLGTLLMSYPLGWAADRYGSRPVMEIGLVLSVFMPLGWVFMPRHSDTSLLLAMTLSFVGTVVGTAWGTGSTRYLFTNAVPRDQKTGYMAVWYAWNALVAGSGPLMAGWLLHVLGDTNGLLLGLRVDAYTPLFVFNALTTLIGVFLIRRVRDDEATPLRVIWNSFTTRTGLARR